VTDAKNASEDWGVIMDLCDRVQAVTTGPKDCLKAIIKRLNHQDPHVVIQAITVSATSLAITSYNAGAVKNYNASNM
jgi:signal transducing adaptor molecule